MSVKVVARLRPLLDTEDERDAIVTAHRQQPEDGDQAQTPPTLVRIPNPRNEGESFTFQFNRVFEAHTTQKDLFEAEVKPTVKHLFSGYDVTLFAYGVTGTGKTHTMRGGKSLEDRGIIPRLLSSIYRRSRTFSSQAKGTNKVTVSMSYYEIYNDKVYDLFEPPEKRTFAGLPLRDSGGRTVVVGLTERSCEDLKTFEKLYDQANVNRSTSATKLNAHSSRSHAILRVKLSITSGDKTTVSTASCIDLAGSEDNRRTENNKERLVESSAINKSLFVLSQCVEAISEGKKRIPYRESKMTRILSLGQNKGLCICLLNLAPVRSFHLDTLSSLNFANRTKKIEIREAENDPVFLKSTKSSSTPGYALPRAPQGPRRPLQTISTTKHNSSVKSLGTKSEKNVGADPNTKAKASASANTKLPRAFAVFKDAATPRKRTSVDDKRNSSKKRDSSFMSALPKTPLKSPWKAKRASVVPAGTLSPEAIEELVEKKVSEVLEARARISAAPVRTESHLSTDVARRLAVLEEKIEATLARDEADERAEGLSYLLMAKQHLARGEQVSALKMYQLARPYFPKNRKLEAKMQRLREKIEAGKLTMWSIGKENIPPELMIDAVLVDDEAADEEELPPPQYSEGRDSGYSDDNSDDGRASPTQTAVTKQRRKRAKRSASSTPLARPVSENLANISPRAQRLLDIVNTSDLLQVRGLTGTGKRMAPVSTAPPLQDFDDVASLKLFAQIADVGAETGTRGVQRMRSQLMI